MNMTIFRSVSSTVILWSILVSGAMACSQQGSQPVQEESGQSAAEIERYWTKERMKSAVPLPMGRVVPDPDRQLENNETGEPTTSTDPARTDGR